MASIIQRSNGRFQVKVRRAGHSASKTFDTRPAAENWAKRFEAGLDRYKHNVTNNFRMVELAPLLSLVPHRVLDALAKVPYTKSDILEAAVDADNMIGIYFLIHRGDVVYVGQSKTDVLDRIAKHRREGKVFDQYTYLRCSADQLDALESMYIDAFLPAKNSSTRPTVTKL